MNSQYIESKTVEGTDFREKLPGLVWGHVEGLGGAEEYPGRTVRHGGLEISLSSLNK